MAYSLGIRRVNGGKTLLSFEHKKSIFSSFPELRLKSMSNDQINFLFLGSRQRGKVLACELQASGNGYICGRYMNDKRTDVRGWISIKKLNEEELRELIRKAIVSMK